MVNGVGGEGAKPPAVGNFSILFQKNVFLGEFLAKILPKSIQTLFIDYVSNAKMSPKNVVPRKKWRGQSSL